MAADNPYAPPAAEVAVDDATGLASRWARLGGAIIDGIITTLIVFPAMFAMGYWDRVMAGEQTFVDALWIGVLGFGGFVIVNGYLLANHGQTVGKRLVRTRIVSVHDETLLSLPKVIGLRYLPLWVAGQIPLLGPVFGLVDPLFVFRGDKRCIHDLIAGTKVVVARPA